MQRITRYPLLLGRVYDLTAPQDDSRELIIQAQRMILKHIEINNSVRQSDSFEIIGRDIFVSARIYTIINIQTRYKINA
jgi:hypothetical protein